jgi:DNA polymerase-3 subunit gamma/tau
MSQDYKVLYRKYRPSSFDEIVGQKYTINMLKNAVLNNKLSHAYIFTGPRGTGKTSTAKIFAKTINCEHPINGIPCGKCNSCLNTNNNADIIEIDAASNNGVDEIRELINNVKIAPSFSKYKVYIIDEVHMLSQSAFNALLLTLEEPPSHIVFILATTNIESVPITILSRCQRYDFKKIKDEDIVSHLKTIAEKENIDISDEAIREIAYLSDGGLRDALSILNQLFTSNSSITIDTVLDNYGSVSMVLIKKIVDSFLNNDFENLKSIFDNLENMSIDYKTFIKKLVDELFSEAITLKINNNQTEFDMVKECVFELNDLINKININVNPFLLILMIFLKYMNCSNADALNISDNDEKVEVKNKDASIINESVDINESVKKEFDTMQFINKISKIRINNCFAEADKRYLGIAKSKWNNFITNISSTDAIKNLIVDCDVVLASPKIFILTNLQDSMVNLFNNDLFSIEQKFYDIIGENVKLLLLSVSDWNKEKEEYIKNLKDGYVYKYQDEPIMNDFSDEVNNKGDVDTESNNELDIDDIFDKNKIEIK